MGDGSSRRHSTVALPDGTVPGTRGNDVHLAGRMQGLGGQEFVLVNVPSRLIVADIDGDTVFVLIWARTPGRPGRLVRDRREFRRLVRFRRRRESAMTTPSRTLAILERRGNEGEHDDSTTFDDSAWHSAGRGHRRRVRCHRLQRERGPQCPASAVTARPHRLPRPQPCRFPRWPCPPSANPTPAAAGLFGPLPGAVEDAAVAARLQAVVDAAVGRGAPDVMAAVITPRGTWSGAAGVGGADRRPATAEDAYYVGVDLADLHRRDDLRLAEEGSDRPRRTAGRLPGRPRRRHERRDRPAGARSPIRSLGLPA